MRKKLYLFIFLSLLFLGGGVSYAGVTITGDRMLSDGNSSQSINGTYNNNSGEVTLTKIENIAVSTINGQGSCNSVMASIATMIQTNQYIITYGYFNYPTNFRPIRSVYGCIETDFNNDGNIELVYSVHQVNMGNGYFHSKDTTYVVKQPNDPLLLYIGYTPPGTDLNNKEINGILVKTTLNGQTQFVTNVNKIFYGIRYNTPYTVIGDVWHIIKYGNKDYFSNTLLNVSDIKSITLGTTNYFIANKPVYTSFYRWPSYINSLAKDLWIYDINFNPVVRLGQNITSVIYPSQLGGYASIIDTKLGTNNWIMTFEGGGYGYISNITTRKKYKINTTLSNYNGIITYNDNNSILFRSPGGILLLDKNIIFNNITNTISGFKETNIAPLNSSYITWEGQIKYGSSNQIIYGVHGNLILFTTGLNPTLTSIGVFSGQIFSNYYYGGMSINSIDLKSYYIYNLQYTKQNPDVYNSTYVDSHIFFVFRKSDQTYLGMKQFNIILNEPSRFYSRRNTRQGFFTNGFNESNYANNLFQRSFNIHKYYNYRRLFDHKATITFSPATMTLSVVY